MVNLSITADMTTLRETDTPATITFTVAATGEATASEHTINVALSGNVSHGGGTTASVNIPRGARNTRRSDTFSVTISDETDADPTAAAAAEGLETLIATLGTLPTVSGLTFRANPNSVTVEVTDTPKHIAFGTLSGEAMEGTLVNVPIVVTGQRKNFSTVAHFSIRTDAVSGTDYEVVTDGTTMATCGTTQCAGTKQIFDGQFGQVNIPIRILDDGMIQDPAKRLDIRLTDHTSGSSDNDPVTFDAGLRMIRIVEGNRLFQASVDDADTTEGDTVTFTVGFVAGSIAPDPATPATVTWTLGGDAVAGDYTAPASASGVLTFTSANWNTARTITATIADDDLNEGAETLTLTLSDATGGGGLGSGIATASAVVTIAESDPIAATLSGGGSVAEGGMATVNVALGTTTTSEVTLAYSFTFAGAGNAANINDFSGITSLLGNSITIASGQSSGSISIALGDDVNEADEVFSIVVSAGEFSGHEGTATIAGGGRHDFTITDDDDIAVSIARAAGTGAEVNEGATANFAVTLSHAADAAVTVGYRIAGDVTSGDYTDAGSGTLTIAMGATTGTIAIPIAADGTAETSPETLRVELNAGAHDAPGAIADGTPNSASVTIPANIAALHVVTVTGPTAPVAEGRTAVFTFSLATPAAGQPMARAAALTATFELGGTAADGTDYTAPAPLSVTFPDGNNADQTVSITATDDNLNEASETLILTLTGVTDGDNDTSFPGGAAAAGSATATIGDNDPIEINLANSRSSVTEGDPGDTAEMMRFAILFTGAVNITSAADITFPYSITGLTPATIAGMDYTAPSSLTLTVPAGANFLNFGIPVIHDDLNEASDEGIRVTLGTPVVGVGGGRVILLDPTDTVQITDDDPITVSLLPPADADPDTMGIQVYEGTDAIFTVMLSGPSQGAVALSGNFDATASATINDDYAFQAMAIVTIPAGATSAPLRVTIVNDGMAETGGEEAVIFLSSLITPHPSAGTVMRSTTMFQHTINLVDLPASRALSVAATTATANEGSNLVFTVTVNGAAVSEAFDVAWSLDSTSTADAADTNLGASGMVRFGVSSQTTQTQTITFGVTDDMLNEGAETLVLTLTDPCGTMTTCSVGGRPSGTPDTVPTLLLAGATATGGINASDPISATLSGGVTVAEGGTATVTVALGTTTTSEVTLTYDIAGSGAAPADAADFSGITNLLNNTVTIASGQSSGSISLALGDDVNEADEGFTVTVTPADFSGHEGTATIASGGTQTFTITDDDDIVVTIARAAGTGATVTEAATANFEVTLSHAADAAVTVGYRIAGDVDSADYTDAGSGTLTIAMGATTGAIAIPILADGAAETSAETLRVDLDNSAHDAPGAIANGTPNSASVTIAPSVAAVHIVTVAPPAMPVTEGSPAVFAFSLASPAAGQPMARTAALTATFSITGTAADGTDYTAPSPLSVTFPDGDNSDQTVSIATTADTLNEADKTLVLTLTGVTDGDVDAMFPGGTDVLGSATAMLPDDDDITYSIAAPAATVTEGNPGDPPVTLTFPVTLTGAASGSVADITIPYSADFLEATRRQISTPLPNMVTIPAGAVSNNIVLTVIHDLVHEGTSRVPIRLSDMPTVGAGAGRVRVGAALAEGTLADNDVVTVSLLPPPDVDPDTAGIQVFEAADAVFTIMLDIPSITELAPTISITSQGGSSTADYMAPRFPGAGVGRAVVPAGTTSFPYPITIAYDGVAETGEMLVVSVSGTSGAGDPPSRPFDATMHTISLVDVDALRTLSVAATTATANEGGDLEFTFTVSGTPVNTAFDVGWSLDSTSTAVAMDYSGPAMVTFAASAQGTQTQTLTLRAVDDMLNEDAETLVLALTDPCAGMTPCSVGGRPSGVADTVPTLQLAAAAMTMATGTIAASDPIAATLSGGGSVAEGGTATVAVALGATTTSAVTLTYDIGGTGVTAADFSGIANLLDNTVNIASDQSSAGISLTLAADDNVNEADKDFTVTVAGGDFTGQFGTATVTGSPQTFTIADSDPITVSIARAAGAPDTIEEGDTAAFTATLSVVSEGVVTVSYTASGTTDMPMDANGGSITIPAGAATGAIALTIPFSPTLNSSSPDQTLTVTLGAASVAAPGGGTVTASGSATVTVDYIDAVRTLAVTGPAAIAEGSADVESSDYTVTLDGMTFAAATDVTWTVSHGETEDADFVAASDRSGVLSFTSSDTSMTFTLTVDDDTLNEAGETFTVQVSVADPDADGGTAYGTPYSTTITDATDDAIEVAIARDSGTMVNVGEAATADFSVTLAGGVRAADLIVPFTFSGTLDNAEYDVTMPTGILATATGGTLTFAADGTETATDSLTVTVNLVGDTLNEAAETLTLTGTAPGAAGLRTAGVARYASGGDSAMVTVDDDDPITVSLAAPADTDAVAAGIQVLEVADAVFTVMLSGASAGDVSVTVAVTGADAADYTAPAATATVLAGMTSVPVTIPIAYDGVVEMGEMLTVAISAPMAGAGAGAVTLGTTASQTVALVDVAALRTLSVDATTDTAVEGADLVFTLTVEGIPVAEAFDVAWSLDAASTAAATDVSGPGMVSFAVSANSRQTQTLTLRAVDDMLNEASETLTLTLTDPCPGGGVVCSVGGRRASDSNAVPTLVLATASDTATITDNDEISVMPLTGPAAVRESAVATYTVTLSAEPTTAAVTVDWTVAAAGTAVSPVIVARAADFMGSVFPTDTLTFAAGVTSQSISFTTTDGGTSNTPDRAFTITLSNIAIMAGGGTVSTTAPAAFAATIREAARLLTVTGPASVAETDSDASATYSVALTGDTFSAATALTWTVTPGTAAVEDFAATTGTVTFGASDTRVTFDVIVRGDNLSEMTESFTVGVAVADSDADGGTAFAGTPFATDITDDDTIGVMSLTGLRTVAEDAAATYTVTLDEMPTMPLMVTWTVAGRASGDVIAATAADFVGVGFPTGTLTFAVGVTLQSLSFTTTAGAPGTDGSTDNTPNRAFTITLSNIMGGGGMTDMTPPAAFTATIREDDPAERAVRMEQAATTLNRAAVALTVPVIARRFDPGRGLTSPGLALNLGGKQVLAPPGGAAASAGGGAATGGYAGAGGYAAPGGYAATGGYAAPGGYAAIGLPKSVIPAKAGIQHTNSPAPAGLHQPDAGVGAVPAPVAGAVLAQTPGGALSAAPDAPPAADGQGSPSQPGPASLDMGALAELAAAQLEGLDSLSPNTESRTLQQLLGNSGFSATSDRGGGRTLSVWGRGSYTSLDGEPEEGGNRYDYDGDSYAFYLGLDGRYGDYLAGLAVGYTVGDLELRTVSGPAAGAAAVRSDFESDLVAVYPYASWQPSDRLSVWVLTGYGQGELEIEERTGTTTRKATSDTDLWLGAAGLSLRRPTADGGPEVLLRLSGTVLHGETDGGRFDDGTDYAETETDAQQLRSEVELGQAFGFGDGGRLRPYLTAGVSYDFGDGSRDTITGEFGAGFQLQWPRLGLETEWEGEARLASKGDRNYREYTGTGTLRYDLGNDRRGLQLALRPAFGLTQGVALGGSDTAVMPLDGGAFGGASSSFGGASSSLTGGGAGSGAGGGLGLHGELSYGIGNVRALGLPGLLTLYGAGGLSAGSSGDLYRGGVRFEAARFTLGAGLQHESGGDTSDRGFLLDGAFRF